MQRDHISLFTGILLARHLALMSFQTNNTFVYLQNTNIIFFMKPETFLFFHWKSMEPELWEFRRCIELIKYDKVNCTWCTRTKLISSCGSSKICLPEYGRTNKIYLLKIKLSLFYVYVKIIQKGKFRWIRTQILPLTILLKHFLFVWKCWQGEWKSNQARIKNSLLSTEAAVIRVLW